MNFKLGSEGLSANNVCDFKEIALIYSLLYIENSVTGDHLLPFDLLTFVLLWCCGNFRLLVVFRGVLQ